MSVVTVHQETPITMCSADFRAQLVGEIETAMRRKGVPSNLGVTAASVVRSLRSTCPQPTPEILRDGEDILRHLGAVAGDAGEPEIAQPTIAKDVTRLQQLRDSLAGARARGDEADVRVLEAALHACEPVPA